MSRPTPLPATLAAFLRHFMKKQPISFALFFLAPAALVLEADVVPRGIFPARPFPTV
jgi:hypothetical protein